MKAAGLADMSSVPLNEMVDCANRDRIVSFCNSDKCTRGMAPSPRGRAIGIGYVKKCPHCGFKVQFACSCTPAEIIRYKKRFVDFKDGVK